LKFRDDEVNHQQEAVFVKQVRRLTSIWGIAVYLVLLTGVAVAGTSGGQQAEKPAKQGDDSAAASRVKDKTPAEDEFIKVDMMPILMTQEKPVYPKQAQKDGIEGEVWIRALIGTDGTVQKAKVQKSSGKDAGLDDAALNTAYKNTYKPALADGEPVAVWVSYKVAFKLQESSSGEKKGK